METIKMLLERTERTGELTFKGKPSSASA